ncbi:hypothetical protein KSU01_08135 [Fusobacterium animalis]|uniref:hypothetical protein n=1 Tax=Fusobacterium animalis TaxID=76859 RepID=UPI0030D1CEF4
MDFKTGKLHKIIREFEKGNGRYEINGIDLKNTVFLYREKAGAFIPIPKGNYKTIFNDNESILEVDDVINNKAIEFQIISVFDVQSYKYLEKYPELKMVVVQTNKIVDDINNIIGYLNSVGVKTDSKYQTQILTPLEPLSVWYMNAEGLIDTLPIDDFNKKFKEIIEKMSELADEKAQEQVKKRLDELKTEIENFKNKKISEVLKELKTEKDNSIKEIEKIKEKSKSELNSRMPEINNKFNGIAGGTINPTFIQDDGEKTEGQYYLDRPTGKLYRCIKTTSNAVNSAEYFKDMSLNSIVNRLENLKRKDHQIMYAGGFPVPVGTSGKLPDYVRYNNILDYYFKIRFFGGVSFYVVLDNSTNTNIVDYTLFNGIKFHLDINTNILKLVADPQSQLISISVFNKLT